MRFRLLPFLWGMALFYSCDSDSYSYLLKTTLEARDSLKQRYAPDGRVAMFRVEAKMIGDQLTLTGESDQPAAVDEWVEIVKKTGVSFDNRIVMLPDSTVGERSFAVVNNSVANLRSEARHSSELASQATLGTVLKVLKITKEWYLVQSPDDYIAWVDHGGVKLMSATEKALWSQAEKIIVLEKEASVYGNMEGTTIVSDLVMGDVLERLAYEEQMTKVRFPDGRTGYVSSSATMPYDGWLDQLSPSGELVAYYARQLMGAPYLWGGTSVKAMDCSGFTKTVYFMNGLVIPRDASQQVMAGMTVDKNLQFEGLQMGDLLFFGKPATDSTRRRVTHVGIWLDNNEFIHASQRVRVSSIDPESAYYDEFNKNRYLGSKRYLNHVSGNIEVLQSRFSPK